VGYGGPGGEKEKYGKIKVKPNKFVQDDEINRQQNKQAVTRQLKMEENNKLTGLVA